VGEILFGRKPNDPEKINLMSPDNTSDGWLRKKWIIAEGKRYMVKGGGGYLQQEPYNEVIASVIMQRLGVSHIEYSLIHENEKPYCVCENFITPNTELITAWQVIGSFKKNSRDSDYTHFLRSCEILGIPNVQHFIDQMLTIDYIIANEDRHYNNFGFIRNSETLKWIGAAPIYDSGTSLWLNTSKIDHNVESKPFRSLHREQIKLVQDLKWFDFNALKKIDKLIIETYSKSQNIDETRAKNIAETVVERANHIKIHSH
jgi:hypothetical protein